MSGADTGLRGAALARAALEAIRASPDRWKQNNWVSERECGTAYCFGGWVITLAGGKVFSYLHGQHTASHPEHNNGDLDAPEEVANTLLGLTTKLTTDHGEVYAYVGADGAVYECEYVCPYDGYLSLPELERRVRALLPDTVAP